jgi:hypothetical protein
MTSIKRAFAAHEREAFSFGDCWLLARAMHSITGWQMVAVGNEAGRQIGGLRDWVHLAVRTPHGEILDINGFHDDSMMVDFWSDEFFTYSSENGLMEVFDVDVDMWDELTCDQDQQYPHVDPILVSQRLLQYYISQQIKVG